MTAEKQDSTSKMMQKMTAQEVAERAALIYEKDCLAEVMNAINNRLFGDNPPERITFEERRGDEVSRYTARFE